METPPQENDVVIRSATNADIPGIITCIQPFVKLGKVLPRTVDEMEELIPHYWVAEFNDQIVGCVVLEIYSQKLAEIRSLVVSHTMQGRGLGRKMVEICIERAKKEDILELMAITSQDDFFQACGFDYTLPGEKRALFLLTGTPPAHHPAHGQE
jgi:N-acetylglutamate synthase-like GNAT family acetyltransferase